MNFKVGDRVVWTRDGDRGVVVELETGQWLDRVRVRWDEKSKQVQVMGKRVSDCKPKYLVLEEIWDSPLAKLMREEDDL